MVADLKKCEHFKVFLLQELKQPVAAPNQYLSFYGDNQYSIIIIYVKFCMKVEHSHAHNLCMKCCLQINNCKHGDGANFRSCI